MEKYNIVYSVVVPFFNEEQSIKPLYESIVKTMDSLGKPYEMIFVNDGSTDGTGQSLKEIAKGNENVIVINLNARSGQTCALKSGFERVRGDVVISMDGDMQNDPNDIPKLISELRKGYDLVCGWRYMRKDPFSKKIASKFANIVQSNVFKSHIHDISCTLRAYTKDSIKELSLKREGAHRFIPYLLMMKGRKASEVKVNHRSRPYGRTKYGFNRSFKVAYDFLSLISNRRSWL